MPTIEPPTVSALVAEATVIKPLVWHGPVFSAKGKRKAYIKQLPTRKLLVECVAAVVGRAHDLPIPAPHLIMAEPHQLPGCTVTRTFWAFGCEDGETPSLARLTTDPAEVTRRLRSWKRASEAAAFDAWIGNGDRTAKNILWSDDSTKVGLIDHDDALPDWLQPDADSANQLMQLLCDGCDEFTRRRHRKDALKCTSAYGKTNWVATDACTDWALNFTDVDNLQDLIAFLAVRLQHLPALLSVSAGLSQAELRYV